MRHIKILFIITLISCISIECKKEVKNTIKEINISGNIIDYLSLIPLDSVQITLKRTLGNFSVGDEGYFYSDSMGKYKISFSPIAGKDYWIVLYKKGCKTISSDLKSEVSSQVYDFKLFRDSTYKE